MILKKKKTITNQNKQFQNHTFAICAYKESRYLEKCIISLLKQNVKSNIIMATSTPNEYIEQMAEKYHIPLDVYKRQCKNIETRCKNLFIWI